MTPSNVCNVLESSSHNLTFPTEFKLFKVQGSLRSRAHSRSFQSSATFYSSADPFLHYRPSTNGQGRPRYCSLSPAVGDSMRSQIEPMSNLPDSSPTYPFPVCQHINTSATNRQSLAFDSSSSFLSPGSANSVRNPSDAVGTLAQQRTKINAARLISAPALASSTGERGTRAGVRSLSQATERDNSPTQDISVELRSFRPQSTDFSGLSSSPALRALCSDSGPSLDELSPTMSDSWVSMVNTPLLPML